MFKIPVTPERWQRIAAIYEAALDKAGGERDAFVEDACAGDEPLLRELTSLIAQERHVGPLDSPVWVDENLFVRPISLEAGTSIGPYLIEGVLGAGGMGQVYRARDAKLNRSVALKVLPDAFATDPERRARFQREAQVLAALNHTHIAAIYGFEDSGSIHALVLELVEGPTLADLLARGPMPLDEALPVAMQIADALEGAHDQNIVHRDLKPANIKVRPDGTVKVLDFGLARFVQNEGGAGPYETATPTITSLAMMTNPGAMLGTAAYMSPEQAKGRPADVRSDIWAFGCVLYEMLTGKRLFGGEEIADTLAAILRAEPEWSALPADTPPAIRRLLERSLQKDRTHRLAAIADARLDLNEATTQSSQGSPASKPLAHSRRFGERFLWAAALVAAIAVAGWLASSRRGEKPSLAMRLDIATPATTDPTSLALSPDGRTLAFVADATAGHPQLWLRALDDVTARPMARTDGARYPFWSPDGHSVAFFADFQLKRLDLTDGSVHSVAGAGNGRGGSWNARGVILYSPFSTGGLRRVDASGGDPIPVTQVQLPQQVGHYFPHFLPDDQHFLFLATGKSDASGVYVGDLNGSAPRRLMAADAAATIAGEYVYAVRQNKIVAQRFDWPRLEVTGDVSVVADNVLSDASGRSSALSASSTGIVAYRSGTPGRRQLVWVDRAGRLLSTVGGFEEAGVTPQTPEISPDGKYVAVTRSIDGSRDVWRWDLTRGISNPVTSAPGDDSQPVWSPDGTRIAFSSTRAGGASLYQRAADGTGSEDPLVVSADPKGTGGWSHDGKFFLFNVVSRTEGGIWALPLTGGEKPFNVVRDLSGTRQARFSPDSRWIAFEAEQSGRYEVWVQPFPGPGQRVRISTDGGVSIRWRRDGRELFYLGPDGTLNAVSFKTTAAGVADPSAPVPLFKPRIPGAAVIPGPGAGYYAVAPDGQRFLVSVLVAEPVTAPITILLNWRPPL